MLKDIYLSICCGFGFTRFDLCLLFPGCCDLPHIIRNLLVPAQSQQLPPDGHIQHPFPCLGPLCSSALPRSHPGSWVSHSSQPQATHNTITTSSITTRESNDQNRYHLHHPPLLNGRKHYI